MSRFKNRHYRSFEEFENLECPKFDNINTAIDDLMDTLFLDDVYSGRGEEVNVRDADLEWAS